MLLLLHYCPRLAKARQSLLESIRRCHCQYILYRHRQHLNLKGRNIHPIGKRLPRRITDVPNETQIQNPTLPNSSRASRTRLLQRPAPCLGEKGMSQRNLKSKPHPSQTAAVQAVLDCFKGQPPASAPATRYRIDPGRAKTGSTETIFAQDMQDGFKNADLMLTDDGLLKNIIQVQRQQNLPQSDELIKTKVSRLNLDIEMETGTGKTYCYIKTIFELNRQYGWSKFIIVVPSIAIREGVAKSLAMTAEHFQETYNRKARFFIYNSRQLHHLESFSSDAGINVMVINVQAFAARGADNRRIYEDLDDFQSRKPIDVISANRPILILDEPQKMEGAQTQESLQAFKALMALRYSATHKTTHNKIHRLDGLDAYKQKLVKKIAVRGIAVKGLAGTNAYLYLQSIEISTKKPPEARVEFECKLKSGEIRRTVRG